LWAIIPIQNGTRCYRQQLEYITKNGGTPVIIQSYGLTRQPEPEIVAAYAALARECDGFIAFELGKMFAPCGKIYSLETFGEIMALPQCRGAKHSSLEPQSGVAAAGFTQRKKAGLQNLHRNDLAIDMVMYGSDYLLGLSTFAPDLFAKRDRLWSRAALISTATRFAAIPR